MKFKSLLLGLGALTIVACGTESESTRSISGGVYGNKAIGLTIAFPSTWQIKTDQTYGDITADIVAISPPINGFSPNMTVIIEPHGGPTKMSEILATIKPQILANLADTNSYQDTVYFIGDTEVGEMQYEAAMNGTLLHYLQMLFIKNGKDVTNTITDRADDFQVNADIKSIKASISIQ